ncbi:SLC13 family permease, partial [Candidatus Omnitrophota bacterium]
MKLFVLITFLLTYVLIVSRRKNPTLMPYIGISVLLLFGAIDFKQALGSINFNVLGVFTGTMILSNLFIESGVPAYLAARFVDKSKNVCTALLSVCCLSAFISSFADNVATVLIVAPIALAIARTLSLNPIPLLIGVALSSNLQGCATMIGDAPSIILALESKMTFNDFFWMQGKPGIFFAVELGALASFFVLFLFFRKYKSAVTKSFSIQPKTKVPAVLLVLMVLSLAISSLLPTKPHYILAFICLFWAAVGIFWYLVVRKEKIAFTKILDYRTLVFLIGIFILIGSLTHNGIIDDIAQIILSRAAGNALFAFLMIVWFSVFVSAFVDNIPYTIAMIPVAKIVAGSLGIAPYPLLFGLLIGTCLGGNITPIGASCNIVAVG